MEQSSSSSKVTVEYYDPYGVYQLLSPGLFPRLPLRNLHWESHAGPLRSISSLHIDLVSATPDIEPPTETPSASSNDLSRVKSQDSTTSGDDGFRTQNLGQAVAERPGSSAGLKRQKSRRHQIPGLRQTPYLKIFFLRCDDNETYKTQARKQVREWVKEHAPPSTSSSKVSAQENHDAFEYLIVHVIVPNTAAATQPRASGKGSDGASGSNSEKARWRGGGSTTILEKLRVDFNGTSKSAIDRIAQIRIGINDVPYDMLPRVVPAIPGSYSETQQENENAWIDLIVKFKSLILSSFDMRVGQYEEDIREKDAQRTLPGWNFCTFFVLKEGLSRGFESVGLVEDALVGYDELSVGLDAIVREHRLRLRVGAGPQHGSSFLPFTEDLKKQAERARAAILRESGVGEASDDDEPIDLQSSNNVPDRDTDEIPLDALKKRYRELILANDISIFDFRCYIFARQLSLLLRLANATSSQEELLAKLKEQRESSLHGVAARLPASQPSEDVENLSILGEICRRTMEFVSSIARIMREDVWASRIQSQQASEGTKEQLRSDPVTIQVVDNIVSSFTFAVTQQILAQTSTKALPIPPSTLAPPSNTLTLDGQEQKSAIPEPKTMMHPARTSSLALRPADRGPQSPGIFPGGAMSSMQEKQAHSTFLKAGLEELAAHRAELYVLSRSFLEQAGKRRGWSSGWTEIAHLKGDNIDEMDEIDLSEESHDGEEEAESEGQFDLPTYTHGVSGKLLRTALQDGDDFYRLYETLTDKALRHFTVATRIQSVHSAMADLAVLKYHLKDYAAAASYFYQMTPFYGDDGWAQVEISMLVLYAKCLKELRRKEEFVRVALKLLSKSALVEKERLKRKSAIQFVGIEKPMAQGTIPSEPYLADLLEITASLKGEWEVPLENFFDSVEVDGTPEYHPEQDSFALKLRLRYLLADDLSIEKAKIRIANSGGEGRDIWLETNGPSVLENGIASLTLQSNAIVTGTYLVDFVGLYTGNIALQYDRRKSTSSSTAESFFRCPKLLIYQRIEAFDAQLYASRYMHLDRTRFLEIGLSSGWNDASKGELHIRAATAGLRLQTSEATIASGTLDITTQKSEPGIVRFGRMASDSSVKIRMPFNLEHEVNDIALRLEISYTTEKGKFFFAKTLSISIMLPLGVNVQDVFKHKALFSKFTITSATSSPLRLLSSRLEASDVFNAEGGTLTLPLVIFPRQPASMLYKITKIAPGTKTRQASQKPRSSLALILNYVCIEEEIDKALTQELGKALQGTLLQPYTRLVLPTVTKEFCSQLNPYELERIAVLSEISTSTLSGVNWRGHFAGLGRLEEQEHDIATLLSDKLQAWQKVTPAVSFLPISLDEETISKSRSIIIPVDVPSVTVVHTADLRLHENLSVASTVVVAALNQPIPASLDIKWTKKWATENQQQKKSSEQPEFMEFFYEVSGPADTWLIGGKRKGHFKVPSNPSEQDSPQKISFPVVLIPVREGFLQFPNVDIKSAPSLRSGRPGTAGSESSGNQSIITCEMDYKNLGETVRCISDAMKTTVSLDASGPQGGAWLLESERRSALSGGEVVS